MNVNVTIEMRSPVSEAPKNFKLAMASRRAAFSGNTSLVITCIRCQHIMFILGMQVLLASMQVSK